MTFLTGLALALLGLAMAAGLLRVALAEGSASWGRAVAVAAVAVLGATGLANAGDSLDKLRQRHGQWAPFTPSQVVDVPSAGAGVDPAFIEFAKEHMLRGESFFLSEKAQNMTRMWLNYRLAPNIAEDKLAEADWIIHWQEPDPFRTYGLRPEDVEAHQRWGPDVGLIRMRRAG